MKKLYYSIIIGLSLLILVSNKMVIAQDMQAGTKNLVEVSKLQDAGNKICPVTGEKIDETTKATYEYEGKIYNFCCAMCIDAFKKDPQKYIKKIEEELQVRDKEQKQETMTKLETLEFDRGVCDAVEFGCGYGTFTIPAAKMISDKLFALDIETEMVEAIKNEAAKYQIKNLEIIVRDFMAKGTGLKAGFIDPKRFDLKPYHYGIVMAKKGQEK